MLGTLYSVHYAKLSLIMSVAVICVIILSGPFCKLQILTVSGFQLYSKVFTIEIAEKVITKVNSR